ncbi:hypothetical protein PS662_01567 [Pseudomonas fluorescens]|uniref:ATPase AAA-type core domain-containing protein n=1 Tax=Pseudomonas fluorescens TaxID=294 RepID=A0A5E6RN72_PSEFL|nr:AAA family ATPase [Pseudomonas fluorescens]VVM66295.1 hypothetical protein PS662_01567 [Pseudomonas fluorescens]
MNDGSVLIVPSAGDQDDYGFKTRVEVRARLVKDDFELVFEAYIGFMGGADERNGSQKLDSLVEEAEGDSLHPLDAQRFFTMLPDMESYRRLVQKCGVTRAVALLTAMRDVVAFNKTRGNSSWVESAVNTDVFLKSFIRSSESYFAYKKAGAVLKGLEFEEFHELPRSLAIRFQLAGRSNEHMLKFRFEHDTDLPKRIAVIIGKNGVGKSQALSRIVTAALKGDDSFSEGEDGNRVLLNRILAFAPTNEAGTVFPRQSTKTPRVWYRRFTLNRGAANRKKDGLADHILQVARSEEHIGELSRWAIFFEALKAIDNWQQIALPVKAPTVLPILLSRLKGKGEKENIDTFAAVNLHKEPVRLVNDVSYPLSSGEISFLRFAAHASLYVENGSLLLLDEPETHLHPNFISQFVALLDELLHRTGSAAIIATHSAYFVREVFQDQVTVLRHDDDGYVRSETPTLRTFGADIGAISYFVFGEDEPSVLAHRVETKLRSRFKTWEEVYERYKHELSLEILGIIKDSMEAGQVDE